MPDPTTPIPVPAPSTLKLWVLGLSAAIVTSISNTVLTVLGSAAVNAGLNAKQIGVNLLISGAIGAALYLKQSPVPFYQFEGGNAPNPKLPLILAFLGLSLFTLPGCSNFNPSAPSTQTSVRAVSTIATSGVLIAIKDPAQKTTFANEAGDVALVLQVLASGQPLTAEQLQAAMTADPSLKKYASDPNVQSLILAISSLYSAYYPAIGGANANVTAYSQLVVQIANGVTAATAPYQAAPATN